MADVAKPKRGARGRAPALKLDDPVVADDWKTRMDQLAVFKPVPMPSVLERCVLVARAKKAYFEAFPEAGQGKSQLKTSRKPKSFFELATQKMGYSRSSVQRDIQIGERLTDMAYSCLLGSPLENNTARLGEIAFLDPMQQGPVSYLLTMGKADTVNDALDQIGRPVVL